MARFVPWRAPTGCFSVGDPGRESHVVLTGNYRLTISRVRRSLKGCNIWLLVADSRGINVWCAAGGGHLTDRNVITVLETSGIAGRVDHRRLVLPLLAATSLEPHVISERTGWRAFFGPAAARDLPAYLESGRNTEEMRSVPFGPIQRLEIGAYWGIPMALVILAAGWPLAGVGAAVMGAAAGCLVSLAAGLGLSWVPVVGWKRLWTVLGAAVAFFLITVGMWSVLYGPSTVPLVFFGIVGLLVGVVLISDIAGTTPIYGSGINRTDRYRVELLVGLCNGSERCVAVCPRDVLDMYEHLIRIAHPERCIRCGACIVQCREDALIFRFTDGSEQDAATVRGNRLDFLGRRSIQVPDL